MLIITRRVGERLFNDLGSDKIEVVVLGVKGYQVRLGIDAPKHIPVNREEVQRRIDNGMPFVKAVANG